MLKLLTTSLAAAIMLVNAAAAQAVPFGVREGLTLDELTAIAGPLSVQEASPPSFYLTKVPKPHPDLNVYAAVVGDSTGVCQVIGGKLVEGSGAADLEAGRIYQTLQQQLTTKYGKPSAVEKSQ